MLTILPAFFICRQAQAQFPEIEVSVQSNPIDVCGASKRSLIIVYVQKISTQDSIFGYDIEIRYNPEKLYLTDEVFSGTLTEQFADHKLTFPEPGIARGWAASFSNPVRTQQDNQPLIAMSGEYLGDCNDTVQIQVSAISFAHVHNNDVLDIEGSVGLEGVVAGYIADKPERRVEIKLQEDSLQLEGIQSSDPVLIRLQNGPGRGIDTLDMEFLVTNPRQFGIHSIQPVSGVEIIESQEKEEGRLLVKLLLHSTWNTDSLAIMRVESHLNTSDSGTVVVRPVQVSTCACVSGLLGSSIELHSTEKVEVDVAELSENRQKVFVSDTGNEWLVWREKGSLGSVKVVNLLGQEMTEMEYVERTSAIIDNRTWPRGLYLILIQSGREPNRQTILIEKL